MDQIKKVRTPAPGQRTRTKLSSRLLRKARMIAASRGVPVEEYLVTLLRPAVEGDYARIFRESMALDE